MKRLHVGKLVAFSTNHPWIVIILSAAVTLLFLYPLRGLKIESDVMSLLPVSVQKELKEINPEQSPDYDRLAVMVSGKNLYTAKVLQSFEKTIQKLTKALPVGKVINPFSQTILVKTGSRLTPVPLSPGGKAPASPAEVNVFKERLKNDPFAEGFISSKKRDVLLAIFLIRKDMDYIKMMDTVHTVLEPLKKTIHVTITGTSAFSAETERFLTRDFAKLLVFVIITILISYYLGFRSRRAVFIPVLLILSGTIFALGGMAIAGFKLTMVSIVTPPLVLTLGSSYSIHVLNSYYALLRSNGNIDKKEAIITSVTNISGTVILASLTTITGLLSLLLATIQQTREFAIATSFGIFFTALLSLTLLPAFLSLQRIPEEKKLRNLSSDFLSRIIAYIGPRVIRKKYTALFIITAIVTGFILVYPHIVFNTSPSKYFPANSSVIRENAKILSKIGGIEEMSIVFTPKEYQKGFFLKADVLRNIRQIETRLKAITNVSFVFSFPAYVDYAGEVLTGKKNFFSSRGLNMLVARLFHTAQGDLSDMYVNKDFTRVTTTIKVYNKSQDRPIDEHDTIVLKKEIQQILTQNVDTAMSWKLNAMSLAFLNLSHQMRRDFLVSTLGALAAIFIIAFIAFRSFYQSLLALVPLLAGIMTSLIFMALFRIPLDMTTIMVSCVSIGVGVDDSIHFLLQHHINSARFPENPEKAVYETLLHTGRPIVLTTVSIVAGLLFLTLAQFQPIRYFGLLIVFTLSTAMLSTLFLLPPLLAFKYHYKEPKR